MLDCGRAILAPDCRVPELLLLIGALGGLCDAFEVQLVYSGCDVLGFSAVRGVSVAEGSVMQ